ncbi:hypothetical protein BDA96_09G192500 [Sorghum bicolor]|uniref:Cysteine proteinase inhibitor n=1 Tax=Sorghum bicolor TaxID=4558 RepID=A0A921QAV8_SORBI|nr:hypothetical protein BDA96_09G192500 [Sorghum bicolor]
MRCDATQRSRETAQYSMSLLRGVQRLALGVAAAAAARGRLPLAALRSRFSSAYIYYYPTAAAARSRFFATGSRMLAPDLLCGGVVDAPGREMHPDAIELARFAVAEHNSKTNAALEFVRLVKVRTQLVAGRMYYFTVEVREVDGGASKLYEAKVWLRPWENFKGLHAFDPVADAA